MRSQCMTVDKRWATSSTVRPSLARRKLALTAASVAVSSAAVASSHSSSRGWRSMARAMATRCFSPPLSLRPRSPTVVSKPSGSESMSGVRLAASAAACTASGGACGSPYCTL
mmetsp:Transcript_2124/g.8459  ORF Transcript_2124/g.8459 Transcript_2124/m.8459 type:complete len:113 (-) Transcript_2124:1558-1896(-)